MTTTMGPGTLRHRLLVVAAALAVLASLVAIAAPTAWASSHIDLSIPIDTHVRGQPGAQGVLATVETGDLEGQECSVSATSENQRSTHPNNNLIVGSGSSSVVLEDVESVPMGTVHAEGLLTLGPTVTITLVLGEDGVFSAGLTVHLECEPPLVPVTDLEVTKVDLVDPVVVDSDNPTALITYEVTVSNNGPELAENVVVTDTLPATLTYVSATPAVGSCSHAAGVVTCELGDLAVGGSVLITIVVETEAVGEITDFSPLNVVEVSSDTEETNLENNVDDEETNIIEVLSLGFTDLEVTKIDLVDPVVVDSDNPTALITYEVTVSNNGPELAENVVVTDTLPATLTYVSATPAVGSCSHAAGVVTCELGDLAVGGSVLITIVVETEAVGEITDLSPLNVVEVSSDTEEVNLENNVDSEETNIVEVLDLVVLPFTGIDTPFMLTGAIMLLGAGLTLVFVSRRREFEI
ncbi:MAG: DUF11 domain-containing protein [Acidimicrobiia bacterium]